MNKIIKNFSPVLELVLILTLGLGFFIFTSTKHFLLISSDYNHLWHYNYTDRRHYILIIYEIIAFLIIAYILKVRGWTLNDFHLRFTYRLIWIGILLLFAKNVIGNASISLLELFNVADEKLLNHVQFGYKSGWISIILIVLINSFFEEFILIGYLFKRLEKYHSIFIIGFSMVIRELLHTYQGWISLFSIVPMSLVFGYYYYRYKKLWPLVIAHGFSNLLVFLNMHFHWYELIKDKMDNILLP